MTTVTDDTVTMRNLLLISHKIAARAGVSVDKVLQEAIDINNVDVSVPLTKSGINMTPKVHVSDFQTHNPFPVYSYPPVPDETIRHEHTSSGSEGEKSYREPIAFRYDLIPEVMLQRLAMIYEEGAKKYGEQAYIKKPLPFSVIVNHIKNHHNKYIMGDKTEDHLAKIIWGYTAMMILEELYEQGRIEDQNDLDSYGTRVSND